MSDILWFMLAFVVIGAQLAFAFILGAKIERGRAAQYLRSLAASSPMSSLTATTLESSAAFIEKGFHHHDNFQ